MSLIPYYSKGKSLSELFELKGPTDAASDISGFYYNRISIGSIFKAYSSGTTGESTGFLIVNNDLSNKISPIYTGEITTNANYTIAKFTKSGTFIVTTKILVNFILIGGGGAGGHPTVNGVNTQCGGGGGAGGVVLKYNVVINPGVYSVIVGDGGVINTTGSDNSGKNSTFNGYTAYGGGGGGNNGRPGYPGGSGGGGTAVTSGGDIINNSGQGYPGGYGQYSGNLYTAGGGGGAVSRGSNGFETPQGGFGITISNDNLPGYGDGTTLQYYAAGGGGAVARYEYAYSFDYSTGIRDNIGGRGGFFSPGRYYWSFTYGPFQVDIGNRVFNSRNGEYRLDFQGDTNLVIYPNWGGDAIWASGGHGGATRVNFQSDGNLVKYNYKGEGVWSTDTNTLGDTRLLLDNDGRLKWIDPTSGAVRVSLNVNGTDYNLYAAYGQINYEFVNVPTDGKINTGSGGGGGVYTGGVYPPGNGGSGICIMTYTPITDDSSYIQILPLPSTDFSSDNSVISGQSESFRNGTYTMSSSSCLSHVNPYMLFNNAFIDGKYWHCYYQGVGYTQQPYIQAAASTYQGGGITGTYYQTYAGGSNYPGEYVQIKLPYQVYLTSYTLYTGITGDSAYMEWNIRGFKKFYVMGSNDGNTWNVIDSQNLSLATGRRNKFFQLTNNNTKYYFYRLVVNEIFNSPVAQLGKWYLYGKL